MPFAGLWLNRQVLMGPRGRFPPHPAEWPEADQMPTPVYNPANETPACIAPN